MKQKITYISIYGLIALLNACSTFAPVDPLPPVVTAEVGRVTPRDVIMTGHVSNPDTKNSRQEKKSGAVNDFGFVYAMSDGPTLETGTKVQLGTRIDSASSFSTRITGLTAQVSYFFRAYAKNEGGGVSYSQSFKVLTSSYVLPVLTTAGASGVTKTSANVNYSITSTGDVETTSYGVCYSGSNVLPSTSDLKVAVQGSAKVGNYVASLGNLAVSATYYARGYAVTNAGVAYGNVISFKTGEPSVLKDTTFVMNYSNVYDLETGYFPLRNGMEDVSWYPFGQPAGLYSKNGAKFFVMGIVDFRKTAYADLLSLAYSTDFVDGSYTTKTNKLSNGTVVAYITNAGRYGKMRINAKGSERNNNTGSGGDMEVTIVTYNTP